MQESEHAQPTYAAYVIGFGLSLVLTLAAYFTVTRHALTGQVATLVLAGLAVAQLLVQLVFFLHLGRGPKPRWNLVIFCFMLLVVGILVIGTLWIMHNLDYNMMHMPKDEIDSYMHKHEGM